MKKSSKATIAAILLAGGMALAQTKKPDDSFRVNVSSQPGWESGELKTCSTYFNWPGFLLCDEEVRESILLGWKNLPNGGTEKVDPNRVCQLKSITARNLWLSFPNFHGDLPP
jgi:hypothetical protein